MADLNQSLISQFQPQNDFDLEELLLLLQGREGRMGPRRPAISTTGFPPPTPSDGLPDIGLPERLTNIFQGSPETSRFGVTPLSTGRSLAIAAAPGGTLALGALRGRNILNIQDVQEALGLDQESLFNILNPFSQIARGSPVASLGRFDGRDITLGGLTEEGGTALTPPEALTRGLRTSEFERKTRPGAQARAALEGAILKFKRGVDVAQANREGGRTVGGAAGRAAARSRSLGARAR